METTKAIRVKIPNYNNKLNCDVFIHIAGAPVKPLLASDLPITVMVHEEHTGGEHKEFGAELIDIAAIDNIGFVPGVITYGSHGMDSAEFRKMMAAKDAKYTDKKWAVYIYKKVKA